MGAPHLALMAAVLRPSGRRALPLEMGYGPLSICKADRARPFWAKLYAMQHVDPVLLLLQLRLTVTTDGPQISLKT